MAKYKQDAKYADNVISDDEDAFVTARKVCETTKEKDQPIHASSFPLDGKAFSAINADLVPTFIDDPKEFFDEFGFHKKEEQMVLEEKIYEIENSAHKMKFIAHLEFSHEDIKSELLWSRLNVDMIQGDKLEQLIKSGGIPHSMRPYLWSRLSGATKKQHAAGYSYEDVLRQSAQDKPSIGVQIERSLLHALPNNICFRKKNGIGIDALRRILKAVAFIYPDLGYCEGMGVIAAILLLFCSEESTFWIMTALIEDILPPNYYSQTLLGIIISILKMKEDEIVELGLTSKSSADIFNAISQLPNTLHDADKLIEYMASFEFTITEHLINELRKHHQASIRLL
uniref:Rab-GAP TBC domain-containing protein n=1 Tax=Heterorhabditis bacteriophora TaxID=37862 RepID=A0A1I7X806_HETBA